VGSGVGLGSGVGVGLGAGVGVGSGVVEPGYQSGTSSLLDVELSAVELLEAVEAELAEFELDELIPDVDALELEFDELILDVDVDELKLDELMLDVDAVELELDEPSGLSSPHPAKSAEAAKIPTKSLIFFIKNLLKANTLLL